MSKYWNRRTRRLSPYVPGEQPRDQRYIKLNTNENPAPPSARVREAMHAAVDESMNLYPDPECRELKVAIADFYRLQADQVFVGNGSDEVLAHVFAGLFDEHKPLLCPDISYSFYPVYARLYGIELQTIPLRGDFSIALEDYPDDNGGIIFANPNAPISLALPQASVRELLQRIRDSVVVVDEAYVDFGAESCAGLVADFPNLLVVQTVSKSRSLAGLRVGFALGSAELVEGLERVKNSFNSYPLDRVALAGGRAAFEDVAAFEATRKEVMRVREHSRQALQRAGFEVLESATNFLFARPEFMSAESLYQALKQQGILVRYFDKPRIGDYLRITVGTEAEMDALLRAVVAIRAG